MQLGGCLVELSDCTMDIIDNQSNNTNNTTTNTANSDKNENKMISKYWDFVNIIKIVNEHL